MTALLSLLLASAIAGTPGPVDRFAPVDPELPDPSEVRLATGRPGPAYWQQRVDRVIEVAIDEATHTLSGAVALTYHNRSPHRLDHLWFHLDMNRLSGDSEGERARPAPNPDRTSYRELARRLAWRDFDGRARELAITGDDGGALPWSIHDTLVRVELPEPLLPGEATTVRFAWEHTLNEHRRVGSRAGYELLDDGATPLYEVAQFAPRAVAYTDYGGWLVEPHYGRGEFTLEMGDVELAITVPADHVVMATGTLENPDEVLTERQRERLAQAVARAGTTEAPVVVRTVEEARKARKARRRPEGTKTWRFTARDVRDVAFASCRCFVWDALGVELPDNRLTRPTLEGRADAEPMGGRAGEPVLAMSVWPEEADALWARYSTEAVAHTLERYSEHVLPYPYPVAISVNGPVGGMEYPMLSFNAPRPLDDGTYFAKSGENAPWKHTKHGLIGVVIHEVGHNWFPMILNSDERRWTWMDEGLNTFVQFLTEQRWSPDYPSRRGEPESIAGFMKGHWQRPLMSRSESLLQFGNNGYAKPAAALTVLRETVVGPERFDRAFQAYARAWAFRRPTPADFFRMMDEGVGEELDWFWRGWFFGTDHVDLQIVRVVPWRIDTGDPEVEKPLAKAREDAQGPTAFQQRIADAPRRTEARPRLRDFYDDHDPDAVTEADREAYAKRLEGLEPWERELLGSDVHWTAIELQDEGGLVSPVLLELTLQGGRVERRTVPARVWQREDRHLTLLVDTDAPIERVRLDPGRQTADTDVYDNVWPREETPRSMQLWKPPVGDPPMRGDGDDQGKKKGGKKGK